MLRPSSFSFSVSGIVLEAWDELLLVMWGRLLLRQARSGHTDGEGWLARGQGPNEGGFRRRVESYYPLARPHAVPGVRGKNEERAVPGGASRQTAATTKGQLAWSGEVARGHER